MIGLALLDDTIRLPKLGRDHLGMYFVEGECDPEPQRLAAPHKGDGPSVIDHFMWHHFTNY